MQVRLVCPECGQPTESRIAPESAFWIINCANEGCDLRGMIIVIEKLTSTVIWMSGIQTYENGALFAALHKRDGTKVWPK